MEHQIYHPLAPTTESNNVMVWVLILVLNGIPYPVQSYTDQSKCQVAAFNAKATHINIDAYCIQQR